MTSEVKQLSVSAAICSFLIKLFKLNTLHKTQPDYRTYGAFLIEKWQYNIRINTLHVASGIDPKRRGLGFHKHTETTRDIPK